MHPLDFRTHLDFRASIRQGFGPMRSMPPDPRSHQTAWHYSPAHNLFGITESGLLMPQSEEAAKRRHEPRWLFLTAARHLDRATCYVPHQADRAQGEWVRFGFPARQLRRYVPRVRWLSSPLGTASPLEWFISESPLPVSDCTRIQKTDDSGKTWQDLKPPHIEAMPLKWHYVSRHQARTYLRDCRITPRPVIRFTDQTPDAGAVHPVAGSDDSSGQWMRFGFAGWMHSANEQGGYQAHHPIDVDEFAVIEASDDDGASWRSLYQTPDQH